jgi:hypothetical protein
VPGKNLGLIREALDGFGDRVLFADMAVHGRKAGRILPTVLLPFAERHRGSAPARLGPGPARLCSAPARPGSARPRLGPARPRLDPGSTPARPRPDPGPASAMKAARPQP